MMSLERNERALIDLVEKAAAARREALTAAAHAQAQELLAGAHAAARRSARLAFERERRGAADRLDAAHALLETRRRLARQRRDAALLVAAWEALPHALMNRWRLEASREKWIDAALDAAVKSLPRRGWHFVLAPGCSAGERTVLRKAAEHETGVAPTFDEASGLQAGIAIVADGASVDATLDGLLADRAEVESLLLKHLDKQRANSREGLLRE